MRFWASGITVAACLGVDAAPPATFALWPQYIDAQLSLSHDADGSPVVEASHGGALGTFNMKMDAQSEVALDPLIEAIELTWVPAVHVESSVLDRFLANSLLFTRTNAEGVHLQIKLRNGTAWGGINETRHERVERNVREIVQSTLPATEIVPNLSKGFLAKSLCNFHAWKTINPLQEILGEPTADAPGLCYSSSFPHSSKDGTAPFFGNVAENSWGGRVDSQTPAVERALLEAKRETSSVQREVRLVVMRLGRSSASSTSIEAEYLEAWIARTSDAKEPWTTVLSTVKASTDLLIVKSLGQEVGRNNLEYAWARRGGKSMVSTSPSMLGIGIPKTIAAASVQTTIAGEGFHRRYVMDVKLLQPEACGGSSSKTILVRMPVSNTAYIDLDEIRRMERFGELKLLSFTKHIEIERPSPISSQQVVGLKFAMPSTNQLHAEFPIHFRYQAPSETDLYRSAFVIAPDMFLFCQGEGHPITRKEALSEDTPARDYFQILGLISTTEQATSTTRWLRLSTRFPIEVTEVLTPVGYLPSDCLVSSVTLIFASLGAAILVWVSVGVEKQAQSSSVTVGARWKAKLE
ncbi:hypothetical protein PRIC1_007496 [Phytophthora ramorum]|uniref:uncharacterized protein n=1 Tax=Phytophthora ramorum TaxID=164328 RepID=UPI00309CEE46|nr:hypothetical protein KRP23_2338 [Phytophthora ramorum]